MYIYIFLSSPHYLMKISKEPTIMSLVCCIRNEKAILFVIFYCSLVNIGQEVVPCFIFVLT